MDPTRLRLWTRRLLASGALVLGVGLFLLFSRPSGEPASSSASPLAGGDPFPPAGADTSGAPRVLLPEVHSVSDAVDTDEGWIVLDGRTDRIHALDPGGGLLWSAGGEGRGPGELLRPTALTVVDSAVVVADARGTTLDRFDLDGVFLGRTVLRVTDCLGNLVRGVAPWRDGTVVLLRLCLDPGTGRMHVRADRIDPGGISTTLATLFLKSLRRPGDDLLASGILATSHPAVYLGTTTSRCVRAFRPGAREGGPGGPGSGTGAGGPGSNTGPDGADPGAGAGGPSSAAVADSLCLPGSDAVPMPEDARRQVERALARRPLARVLGLRPPEDLPPFDRVFAAERGLVFRALTSVEGRTLVWVGHDGHSRPLGVPATEHTFVGARSVLVTWQEMEGTGLRIVELPEGLTAR